MSTVKVPANVDTADKVLFGLTARQVVILAPAAVIVIAVWKILNGVVPAIGLLIGCAFIVAVAVGLVLGRRDGTSLDRLVVAALRQPRHALAPGRVDVAKSLHATAQPSRQVRVGALRGPVRAITNDGVLDLGGGGFAIGLDASTVNFALRSDQEQSLLTSGFARVLHSVPAGLHFVVSSATTDVSHHVARARQAASKLPDPELAEAARAFAGWLDGLTDGAVMLRRIVTIVVTAPSDQSAARASEIVTDGCAAIGVRCTRLDAAALAARVRSGVDPFAALAGEQS